jgi:hypothetical protein
MRGRLLLAAAAAVGLVAGVGLVGAAPAMADQTVSVDCSTSSEIDLVLVGGEALTFNLSNCFGFTRSSSVTSAPIQIQEECAAGFPFTYTDPFADLYCSVKTGPGLTRVTLTASDPTLLGTVATFVDDFDATQTVTIRSVTVAAPDTPSDTTADAAPIPAWVQAYGRPSADASCLDGWNPSWESWAEPVTGGWVCTRSIPSLG